MDCGINYEPSARERECVFIWRVQKKSQERIASLLNMSVETLVKHFADELENAEAKHELELHEILLKHARSTNATAALNASRFLLKCCHGWKEDAVDEIVDKVTERIKQEQEAKMLEEKRAQHEY